MKRFVKLLIISLLCVITAAGFAACGNKPSGSSDETGIICKKFNGDNFYTVIGYNAEEGVTSLDICAAAQQKYGDDNTVITVGRIKAGAFDGNSSLREIVVSDPVDGVDLTIDKGAFKNMKSLAKITLPFVGANAYSDAFYNQTAPALSDKTTTALKATDAERSFGYIFGEEESDYASPIEMNYGSAKATYYIPVALREIVVKPQAEINIPMYAFCGLTQVSKITLDDSEDGGKIAAIGECAFKDMAQLSKINIPASVEVIYANAFEGTLNLKVFGENGFTFDANSTLKAIKESAFKGTSLTDFDLSGTAVTEIGDYAFYGSALTSFAFSGGITTVGAYAFANSEKLETLTNKPADEVFGATQEIRNTVFAGTKIDL